MRHMALESKRILMEENNFLKEYEHAKDNKTARRPQPKSIVARFVNVDQPAYQNTGNNSPNSIKIFESKGITVKIDKKKSRSEFKQFFKESQKKITIENPKKRTIERRNS